KARSGMPACGDARASRVSRSGPNTGSKTATSSSCTRESVVVRARQRGGEELGHAVLREQARHALVLADRRVPLELGSPLEGGGEEVQQVADLLALAALGRARAVAIDQPLVPESDVVDALHAD